MPGHSTKQNAVSISEHRKQLHVVKMWQPCQISAKHPQSELWGFLQEANDWLSNPKKAVAFSWRGFLFFPKKYFLKTCFQRVSYVQQSPLNEYFKCISWEEPTLLALQDIFAHINYRILELLLFVSFCRRRESSSKNWILSTLFLAEHIQITQSELSITPSYWNYFSLCDSLIFKNRNPGEIH